MELIIVYHLILTILKRIFNIGEGNTFGINASFGAPDKNIILILVKQKQNFAWVCIIIMIIVTYL